MENRSDTVALKQKLATLLGDRAPRYFHLFALFLRGQVSRLSLDQFLGSVDPKKRALHNDLILAVLSNCNSVCVSNKRARYDDSLDRSKRSKIRAVVNLDKDDRHRLRVLRKQQLASKQNHALLNNNAPPLTTMPLLSTLAVPNNIDLELLPTSCEDLQDIPSRDHIKSLMKFHSNVSGMPQEPSEGSYDLMLRALQSHLKSLLSSTITKTRSHSISSFSPSIQSELSSLSSSSKQSLSGPPLKLDPNITASSPQPHIQQVYNNSNHPSHLSNGVGASSSIFTNPTALTNNINNNITNSSNSSSSSSSSSSSTTNIIVNGKSSHQSLGLDELSFSLDLAPQLVRSWPAVKIKEKVLAGLDME